MVAIKILPEHISARPQARERFEREARAVSSLNQPHICTLYDVGHQDGIDYLVMEYLEGETLAHRLKKGLLPPDQVLQYAVQMTEALDTAHKHGVIHRDLKPGNVMLTKTGVKLLDFGLAKVRGAEAVASVSVLPTETSPLTAEGTILGTLQYMAPEQLEGKEADTRTDIFALGAVIYEMATGRKAFEGKSQASLISAIMSAEPAPISTLQTMAPSALDHVARTCMAKDPEARWQTTHDVLVELKWLTEAGSQTSAEGLALTQRRGSEWTSWAITTVVSSLLIALAVIHFRERPPEVRRVRYLVPTPQKVPPDWFLLDVPMVSPDGTRVVYWAVDTDGNRNLWVHSLDSFASLRLEGTEGAHWPFWSPDSRSVAFIADAKLKRVDVAGGPVSTLCDIGNGFPSQGAWSKEGIILFEGENGLRAVSSGGGEVKPALGLDPVKELYQDFPQFLPEGRHFLYFSARSSPGKS
jgi:serine/threonine protein kinase